MAEVMQKIDGVPYTWDDKERPYNGFITNISLNIGYNSATTASLTIVSTDGRYRGLEEGAPGSLGPDGNGQNQSLGIRGDPRTEADIRPQSTGLRRCWLGTKVLDLKFLGIKFNMYVASWSISDGGGGKILTVELVDESIDYFQKSLVVSNKFKPERGSKAQGLVWVGSEYFNSMTSTKGELIKYEDMTAKFAEEGKAPAPDAPYKNPFEAERARTEFGTWYWTPQELGKALSKNFPPNTLSAAASSLLNNYDDLFLTQSGTVQSILSTVGTMLGVVFYWDPGAKQIDILTPVDALTAQFDSKDASALVSTRADVSFRDGSIVSQAISVQLAGGEEGNPKYTIFMPSKPISPHFGDMPIAYQDVPKKETEADNDSQTMTLFELKKVIPYPDAGEPIITEQEFQALNLLKAVALGPRFARVYILLKKLAQHLGADATSKKLFSKSVWNVGDNGEPADGGQQNPPVISYYELVNTLFPDQDKDPTKSFGLKVVSPGPPIQTEWGEVNKNDPSSPMWVAQFMQRYYLRNPYENGRLDPKKPHDPAAATMLVKDCILAWVFDNNGAQRDEGTRAAHSHPILSNQGWGNKTYKALVEWALLARKYFTARGTYTPPCEEEFYTYGHRNWLPALPSEPVPSVSPSLTPEEYLNSEDDSILKKIGVAYNPDFGDDALPSVAAADLVENITQVRDIFIQNSCIAPIEKKDIFLGTTLDEANCEINQTNNLHIWDLGADLITNEQRKIADQWADQYFMINDDGDGQYNDKDGMANVDGISAVILPKPDEALASTVVEFSYYPKSGDWDNLKVGTQEFAGVDEIDMFLQGVNIGLDVNGHVHESDITLLVTPDRYEHRAAEVKGFCLYAGGSFAHNSINTTTWGGRDVKALGLIPPASATGAGTDKEGAPNERGSYAGMAYVGECDKSAAAEIYYTGITPQTKSLIAKNAQVQAKSLYLLNKNTDPNLSATYQVMGSPTIPSIKQGLSSLSIQGGQTPSVTYTIGNRKIAAARAGDERDTITVNDAQHKVEDPFMKKFSNKFLDKLDQPLDPKRLFTKAVAKNPNLKGSL